MRLVGGGGGESGFFSKVAAPKDILEGAGLGKQHQQAGKVMEWGEEIIDELFKYKWWFFASFVGWTLSGGTTSTHEIYSEPPNLEHSRDSEKQMVNIGFSTTQLRTESCAVRQRFTGKMVSFHEVEPDAETGEHLSKYVHYHALTHYIQPYRNDPPCYVLVDLDDLFKWENKKYADRMVKKKADKYAVIGGTKGASVWAQFYVKSSEQYGTKGLSPLIETTFEDRLKEKLRQLAQAKLLEGVPTTNVATAGIILNTEKYIPNKIDVASILPDDMKDFIKQTALETIAEFGDEAFLMNDEKAIGGIRRKSKAESGYKLSNSTFKEEDALHA